MPNPQEPPSAVKVDFKPPSTPGSVCSAPAPSPYIRWALALSIHLKLLGPSVPRVPAPHSHLVLLRGGRAQAGSQGLPVPVREPGLP